MAVVKCILIMKAGEGYGWEEIHYRESGSSDPDLKAQLDTFQVEVAARRAVLLGADCAVVGLRASYPRQGVIASLGRKVYYPGFAGQATTSQANSLAIPCYDTTKTRHKTIHLRGFWDSVEGNEAYHPEGGDAAGWTTKLNAYTAALAAKEYGWMSKDALLSTKGKVVGYTVSEDQIVEFSVATDFGVPLVAGDRIAVSFSRINKSKSVLNDSLLCDVVNATTLVTAHPIAAGPFVSSGRFNIRRVSFCKISGCETPSLGERRMGAPLGHYPGRSKARQRV